MKGGWWEGTSNRDGKRGFFPDNYVKVISDNMNSSSAGTPLRGKKFRVKYNYIPANLDELELHVNDVVEVISEIEEGWWEGKLGKTIGVFPSNFVTEITEAELASEQNSAQHSRDFNKTELEDRVSTKNGADEGPVLPPKPKIVNDMCVALFPYEAKHEDELTLKENDVIVLLSTDLPDKGWWKGQLNGKIGVFPDNFVKLITIDKDIVKSEKPSIVKSSNKMSDAVPKLPSYNVAALRKSVQPEDANVANKPVVSKKPFHSTEQMKSLSDKISSSPEKSAIATNTSPMPKPDNERTKKDSPDVSVCEPPRNKPFNTSALVYEKLNAELQSTFAAKEIETVVDGALSSKVYQINNEKYSSKNERDDFKDEPVTNQEVDLNIISRSELLSHPTASRAKAPKRRPPSGVNFKDDDDIVTVNNNKPAEPAKSIVCINGTSDPVHDKAKSVPWVQELKLSQAKKNSTQVNLRSGFTSTGSNVTFRFNRPVSMYSGDSSAQSSSSFQKTNPTAAAIVNDLPASKTQASALSNDKPVKVVTITADEWNALNEKVNTLEQQLELQTEFFRKSIDHLKIKLAEEIENRLEMKNEMEKLTDLVTQV